ncbi:MAG: hypothetical protein DRJ40_08220 [Thermoprotei archaeon]|nr:MAG: hypothetical protein DRJ40_08220 [Thermoprotei archaeon]
MKIRNILLTVVAILVAIDYTLTYIIVKSGLGVEANPFTARFFTRDVDISTVVTLYVMSISTAYTMLKVLELVYTYLVRLLKVKSSKFIEYVRLFMYIQFLGTISVLEAITVVNNLMVYLGLGQLHFLIHLISG